METTDFLFLFFANTEPSINNPPNTLKRRKLSFFTLEIEPAD